MKTNSHSWLRVLLVGASAGLVAGSAWAQPEELPAWLDVVIAEARSGNEADFEDRVIELMDARAEAGMPPVQVFQVVSGQPNVYHFVTPMPMLAMNDDPPAPPMPPDRMARWETRIGQATESVRFFVARTYPEHGIAAEGGGEPAALLFLRMIEVVPGRQADYVAWVEERLMPALRETDLQGHTMSSGFLGDSPARFYHAIPIANWAAFDEPDPLIEVLGESGYQELVAGLQGIVHRDEITLLRPRPDLGGQAADQAVSQSSD